MPWSGYRRAGTARRQGRTCHSLTAAQSCDNMHPSRRRFLLGTAGACAALGTGAWQFLPSRPPSGKWELVRRTSYALGSAVAMSVWHRDPASGEAALDAAFAELE